MELSVVIPCHGGVDDTRACLGALRDQQEAPEMEVLLVDNASGDGTSELDREFAGVSVLRQDRNLGFAEGVNVGLAHARGEWLMVLNNDTMPAPHMVRRLLRAMSRDSRIGMAAPVSNHVKGPALLRVGTLGETEADRVELEAVLNETAGGKVQDAETLAGLCLLFHRRLSREVGPWDGRFGLGNFEDDDFCLRARLSGHRLVIARDAYVHHRGARTFMAMGLDYRQELEARERIFRDKWRNDPAGAAYIAWLDGRIADAARHAEAALGAHPDWPDADLHLGRYAAFRGRHDEAISHLGDYLIRCPLHTGAATLLALQTLCAGDEHRARRLLTWALKHCQYEPAELAVVLEEWSRWHLDRGRGSEAAAVLATAFDLAPARASLHNLLGVFQMRYGQTSAALSRLQRALELGSPEARTNLGICLWQRGEPDAALTHFAAAVRENPEHPLARRNLETALRACRAAAGAQA